MEIFCQIVFTVTFDEFNASLLNKSVDSFFFISAHHKSALTYMSLTFL